MRMLLQWNQSDKNETILLRRLTPQRPDQRWNQVFLNKTSGEQNHYGQGRPHWVRCWGKNRHQLLNKKNRKYAPPQDQAEVMNKDARAVAYAATKTKGTPVEPCLTIGFSKGQKYELKDKNGVTYTYNPLNPKINRKPMHKKHKVNRWIHWQQLQYGKSHQERYQEHGQLYSREIRSDNPQQRW